jgi:uncharacterized protein
MEHVILDTNVFVAAAFNPRSASASIVDDVRHGRLRMAWNDPTRGETRAVLTRIPPIAWENFADLFRDQDRLGEPTHPDEFGHVPDPPDREFAALAAVAGAVLVTSDDHLLGTRDRGAVTILSPSEFLRQPSRDDGPRR